MNLRSYTAYLNLVGQCSTCIAPASAFPGRATVASSRHGGVRGIRSPLLMPASSKVVSGTTTVRQEPMTHTQDGRVGHHGGVDPRLKGGGEVACTATLEITVKSPEDMEETGAFFGADSSGGDVVLLWGDLGTGKTCFARGFIRARVGDPGLAVTSPSYLLDNTYEVEDEDVKLHHMDLYRLRGGADLQVLDIPRVFKTSICLIEWPDRLGADQPVNRLDVHLTAVNEDERKLAFTGHGAWWTGVLEDFQDEKRTRRV